MAQRGNSGSGGADVRQPLGSAGDPAITHVKLDRSSLAASGGLKSAFCGVSELKTCRLLTRSARAILHLCSPARGRP
jgi:hypothetical protein